jgi:YggT family protein
MLLDILIFLIHTVVGLFAFGLMLRFFLQLFRAPVRNPLSTFVAEITNWIVVPARRIVPGLWGLDLATLLLAWLAVLVQMVAVVLLSGHGPSAGPEQEAVQAVLSWLRPLAVLAAIQLVKISLYIVMIAVLAQAVLSWVAPYSPAMPVLNSLSRPFLRIFQRRIKPVGNVDLSPLFVLVIIQILLMLIERIQAWLV